MTNRKSRRPYRMVSAVLGLTAIWGLMTGSASAGAEAFDIPYERFTLANGLRVIVHEDRKAPIVSINVWYGVGSKDEPEGRTGFAHLFEHLMYNGTENYDDEFFKPMQRVGATSVNGNTWFDRTVYYQTVPTPALELVLWMESDRMGHLLPAVTQEKLDEQRSVVKNEKRQGENQPYGRVLERMLLALLPSGHPYRHTTIGSMDDLNAATLEDVHQWFKEYYGAANAVLVLAGDINVEEARPLVERYFGDIPSGPPLNKHDNLIQTKDHDTSEVMFDRVAQPRLYREWIVPGRVTRERALLDIAAYALGGGKNSRMFEALVYDGKSATDITGYVNAQQLASFFTLIVDAQPQGSLFEVRSQVQGVLDDFLESGLDRNELNRIKTAIRASFLKELETISGDDGVAGILGKGELYAKDPAFISRYMKWIDEATKEDVLQVANEWLTRGSHTIEVHPFPTYAVVETDADRSELPFPTETPDLTFPDVERFSLSNGIEVFAANRPNLPLVTLSVVFDAGHAADHGGKLGLNSLTLDMLDEGTTSRSALKIAREAEELGAGISTSATLDTSSVAISALKSNLSSSVELFADIVKNPKFAHEELNRVRNAKLAQIAQEQSQPIQLAFRLLPPMLYGPDHAYGVPMTGTGKPETIEAITTPDLIDFHQSWLGPNNATILVVGDITEQEISPILERHFGKWRGAGERKEKAFPQQRGLEEQRVVLIDKPGAPQSLILAGRLVPSSRAENNIAIEAMNKVFGGEFSSRLNLNLREDKGWAYVAYSLLYGAKEQRPYFMYAPVQSDKTSEAMLEIKGEIERILGSDEPTAAELQAVVSLSTKELPGSFETNADVLSSLHQSVRYGRPLDYPAHLKSAYESLSVPDLKKAARQAFGNGSLIWVVIGDLEKIETSVRGLGFGSVEVRNLSGATVR